MGFSPKLGFGPNLRSIKKIHTYIRADLKVKNTNATKLNLNLSIFFLSKSWNRPQIITFYLEYINKFVKRIYIPGRLCP